jgi:hypothetical protein
VNGADPRRIKLTYIPSFICDLQAGAGGELGTGPQIGK